MSVELAGGIADTSRRAWWKRARRVIIPVAAALGTVGAFLAWGPVGVGPGPIGNRVSGMGFGDPVSRTQPAIFLAPIDAGRSGAVIDSIVVLSDGRYAAPHVISIKGDRSQVCGGAWPLRGSQNFYRGCAGGGLVPLLGRSGAGQIARRRARAGPGYLSGHQRRDQGRAPRPCGLLDGHVDRDPLPRRDQALHGQAHHQGGRMLEQVTARGSARIALPDHVHARFELADRVRCRREIDAEGSAVAFLGVDFDGAADVGNDAMDGRQSEPRALAGRLGGEEALENS